MQRKKYRTLDIGPVLSHRRITGKLSNKRSDLLPHTFSFNLKNCGRTNVRQNGLSRPLLSAQFSGISTFIFWGNYHHNPPPELFSPCKTWVWVYNYPQRSFFQFSRTAGAHGNFYFYVTEEPPYWFLQWLQIPTNITQGLHCLHILRNTYISWFSDGRHPSGCEVVLHCTTYAFEPFDFSPCS